MFDFSLDSSSFTSVYLALAGIHQRSVLASLLFLSLLGMNNQRFRFHEGCLSSVY